MVDIDPQKKEGFEDTIYACLLHHKWAKYEFIAPFGIRPIQFMNPNEKAPSTWTADARANGNLSRMRSNTRRIQDYIVANKTMPKDYKEMVKPLPEPIRGSVYLYF